MICPICKCGHTAPGFASVTLERDALKRLLKSVPAQVCDNCGEEFIDETASANLLKIAEIAACDDEQVEPRYYTAVRLLHNIEIIQGNKRHALSRRQATLDHA